MMVEKLLENLRETLAHLASEALKAKKCGKKDRAEELSIAFKILSEEYDRTRNQDKNRKRTGGATKR